MRNLEKPPSVANDSFKSAKWDELTQDRDFAQSDAPALALLDQISDEAEKEYQIERASSSK